MNLLCRIGLHRAAWHPHLHGSRETWLQIRQCTRCGKLIPRGNR